jgi:hypothetical protein
MMISTCVHLLRTHDSATEGATEISSSSITIDIAGVDESGNRHGDKREQGSRVTAKETRRRLRMSTELASEGKPSEYL